MILVVNDSDQPESFIAIRLKNHTDAVDKAVRNNDKKEKKADFVNVKLI